LPSREAQRNRPDSSQPCRPIRSSRNPTQQPDYGCGFAGGTAHTH
jgi:hypothetical protein